jgi:predicted tellurium resistance membrane protein TerC
VYGQTFTLPDLGVIGLLILLEGVLSIDNALVLALLAKRLPKSQQTRALTYGLAGAFIFRFIAIGTASYLLRWRIVKLVGGGYLLWVALKHLFFDRGEKGD